AAPVTGAWMPIRISESVTPVRSTGPLVAPVVGALAPVVAPVVPAAEGVPEPPALADGVPAAADDPPAVPVVPAAAAADNPPAAAAPVVPPTLAPADAPPPPPAARWTPFFCPHAAATRAHSRRPTAAIRVRCLIPVAPPLS